VYQSGAERFRLRNQVVQAPRAPIFEHGLLLRALEPAGRLSTTCAHSIAPRTGASACASRPTAAYGALYIRDS